MSKKWLFLKKKQFCKKCEFFGLNKNFRFENIFFGVALF